MARSEFGRASQGAGWVLIGGLMIAATWVVLSSSAGLLIDALLVGTATAIGWFAYRMLVTGGIVADEAGVEVVNPLRRYHVPWQQISRFEAASRLVLVTRDGARIQIWAVESANIALMLGMAGHAERVADQLNRRLQRETQGDRDVPRRAVTEEQRRVSRNGAWAFSAVMVIYVIVQLGRELS